MQNETQNPGAAPEPNAPDPSQANPGKAKGLNQDTDAPDNSAAPPTEQGRVFDPSMSMDPEDPEVYPAPSEQVGQFTTEGSSAEPAADVVDLGDPAMYHTGVPGRLGTPPPPPPPPPGTVEQEEGPPLAEELEPDEPSATDWGVTDSGVTSPNETWWRPFEPDPRAEVGLDEPSVSEQAEPLEPEAAAPPLPNLAEQIDPDWPVLEELNGREYSEVQELLGDPSRLSDPEVLEDLNPHQLQAVMQAFLGNLNESGSGVVEEPDAGGEVWDPGVIEDPDAGGEVWDPRVTTTPSDLRDTFGPGDGEDVTAATFIARDTVDDGAEGGAVEGFGNAVEGGIDLFTDPNATSGLVDSVVNTGEDAGSGLIGLYADEEFWGDGESTLEQFGEMADWPAEAFGDAIGGPVGDAFLTIGDLAETTSAAFGEVLMVADDFGGWAGDAGEYIAEAPIEFVEDVVNEIGEAVGDFFGDLF